MLDDITILDFSLQLPGPYATMLLQSAGARVIKIEPPTGDPARIFDPAMVRTLENGKELLTLDLRSPTDRATAHCLAERADVVVEGFRPGVVQRLGIDYNTICRFNPDVVYCSISGFGQDGPYAQVPGHDINYLGISGALAAGHVTPNVSFPVVDLATGTMAAFEIVSAIHARNKTGAGRYIDLAMVDAAVFWSALKSQHGRGSLLSIEGGQEPAYGVFEASDGTSLTIAAVEDKFWRQLCRALAWEDWVNDSSLATYESRHARGTEVIDRLRVTIATRPREEWLLLFLEMDVPAAPVYSLDEVHRDPHIAGRGLLISDDHGHVLPQSRAFVRGVKDRITRPDVDDSATELASEPIVT